jgi:BirA family biotin operon repressor/biotin-[acetyl-CoA-carboxylase] ligase
VETLDDLPSIAELAAVTMQHVAGAVQSFDAEGFAGFHSQWQALDWLAGKSVGVTTPADEITGVAQGIDLDGALLLQSAGELKRIVSGSVTLQPGRITRP